MAAELTRDMINENGGVHGEDIELVFGDSESQPSAGRNEVNRLIQQEYIDAVSIGPFGANLHGADEHTSLTSLKQTALTTTLIATAYCGVSDR